MSIPMRSSAVAAMYKKVKKIDNFDWVGLMHPPILAYLSVLDIDNLRYIATSAKLGGTSKAKKFKMIDDILKPRGFIRMTAGTNRVVYRCDFDQSFLLKIAFDDVGIRDSPAEYYNQNLLKPFVPKVFDVTPCGTVGMFERVEPITNRHEFINVASTIFDLMNKKILGKYVLEDIGTDFFKNWGLRENFGPVLLDFPYLYEIDGNKLVCDNVLPDGSICGGLIDYDNGYNTLMCENCHKRYTARSLGKANGALNLTDQYKEKRNHDMTTRVTIYKSDGTILGWNPNTDPNPDDGDDNIVFRPRYEESSIRAVIKRVPVKTRKDRRREEGHNYYKKEREAVKPKEKEVVKEKSFDETIVEAANEKPKTIDSVIFASLPKEKDENEEMEQFEKTVPDDRKEMAMKQFTEETKQAQLEIENSNKTTTSAAVDRVQIRLFLNDTAYEFLDKTDIDRESDNQEAANEEQKENMTNYLIDNSLVKYPDVEPEVIKEIVNKFVEDAFVFSQEDIGVDGIEEPESKTDFTTKHVTAKDLF